LDREGEFSCARALSTVIALARVLDFAAGKRLRHGSLKPTSVLVTPNGTVRLEGIGLPAAVRSSETGRTAASSLPGANGDPPECFLPYDVGYDRVLECPGTDPQVDLYGLGLILYHMLAGAPPVRAANSSELLFRLRRVGWPALSRTRTDMPADVGRIIDKLRSRGYGGYGKLIDDLQAAAGAASADPRAGAAESRPAGESFGIARLDEICAEVGGGSADLDKKSRVAAMVRSVVAVLKRPRVRKPAMAAAGMVAALLLAFVLMRPVYLSKLAPPLPEEALLAPRAPASFVMPGASPLDAGQGGTGTGHRAAGGDTIKDAEEAFADATRFHASFSDQYALAIEKFQRIVTDFPGTKWASDAQVRLLEIATSRDDAMTHEFEILTKNTDTLVEWEDYRGAVGRYESFLERFPQTKYRDQIRVEMERIRRNAATKIELLAARAEDYITKRLPDLARAELERIIELAVDSSAVAAARFRIPDADRVAKEIAGERAEASRSLAEQLKRRAFVEDEVPLICKETAVFDYKKARATLEVAMEEFPSPVPPGLDALAKAIAASINAEEAFVDSCFAQVNSGKREILLSEFYGKPVKGTVKRVDKTRIAFKLEGETATAAVKWVDLQREETHKFFQLFRGVNIENSFTWGCFCFHRGNYEEAVKYFKMAQGLAGSPSAAAAAELIKLCE
ncbi:MAG: outer membrane protein assembly factor BamD, partial [Planctomycetota bacterium]|nr:outer membrane protein assembly factor BamD [Planctomycetota bacterium]